MAPFVVHCDAVPRDALHRIAMHAAPESTVIATTTTATTMSPTLRAAVARCTALAAVQPPLMLTGVAAAVVSWLVMRQLRCCRTCRHSHSLTLPHTQTSGRVVRCARCRRRQRRRRIVDTACLVARRSRRPRRRRRRTAQCETFDAPTNAKTRS